MRKITVESIKKLFPQAGTRRYAKNQLICYQGDKPHHVFYVLKGHIKYYDIDNQGNEKILHIIGPQNIFPMLYAFGVTEEITAFYCAIDNVEVISIPLSEFHEAIETNITFSNCLTRWFLTEIDQLAYRINSFEKTDARLKIMHALKYLATYYGHQKNEWQRLDFPATQQMIADFTGLARETVSTTIQELEKEQTVRSGKQRTLEIKKSELDKIT